MCSTEITFTIQKLNGETFPISITRTDADTVYHRTSNLYNKYSLDILKKAISKHTGTDPITQQLITHDRELTISDSLIPLEGQLITLITKPLFSFRFIQQVEKLSNYSKIIKE